MVIDFGDASEPWSIARGGAKRWMHCLVRETDALTESQQAELNVWLAEREVTATVETLLVTRGDDGLRAHFRGGSMPVALEELPVWLQRAEPQPCATPAKKTAPKARKP